MTLGKSLPIILVGCIDYFPCISTTRLAALPGALFVANGTGLARSQRRCFIGSAEPSDCGAKVCLVSVCRADLGHVPRKSAMGPFSPPCARFFWGARPCSQPFGVVTNFPIRRRPRVARSGGLSGAAPTVIPRRSLVRRPRAARNELDRNDDNNGPAIKVRAVAVHSQHRQVGLDVFQTIARMAPGGSPFDGSRRRDLQ